MPNIVCSECSTKFNAPNSAAGKKLKCPNCEAPCRVPGAEKAASAFEVVEDDEETETPRSKRKPQDDNDDRPRKKQSRDDDDDDRPRQKKRKADAEEPAKSSKLPIVIVGVVAVLGIGFAAYWFGFRGDKKTERGNPEQVKVNPESWETYTSPDNVFKASFPSKPEASEWKPFGGMNVKSDIRVGGVGEVAANKPHVAFFAGYVRFPDGIRPAEVDAIKALLIGKYAAPPIFAGNRNRPQKITVGNREWDEERMGNNNDAGLVRWHLADAMLHFMGYRSQRQPVAKEAAEQFFASHEILGGDPGNPEPLSLEGWVPYTSANNVFKATFPVAPKEKSNFAFKTATASEFRETDVKDEQTGKTRTRSCFAGYVRFAKRPTIAEVGEVKRFLEDEVSGIGNKGFFARSLRLGGLPFGTEVRYAPDEKAMQFGGGIGGLFRWRVVGSTIYAAGMKNTLRLPTEKEIEKFFGSFEILDAKPDQRDLTAPPNWTEYKAPGLFRAMLPQVFKKDDPRATGNKYAGVPIVSMTQYQAHYSAAHLEMSVYAFRLQPGTPPAEQQRMLDVAVSTSTPTLIGGGTLKPNPPKKVTWAGRDAEEFTYSPADTCVIRRTSSNTIAFVAVIQTTRPGTLDPDVVRAFFDNIVFDKE